MSQTPIEIQRECLHDILCSIDGVAKVYYQPPSNIHLKYPCIIYNLDNINTDYANDKRYRSIPTYTLTLIDKDSESPIQKSIMDLNDGCHVKFNRFFTTDNLAHFVYTLIFNKQLW
jgi:hypothetical protein